MRRSILISAAVAGSIATAMAVTPVVNAATPVDTSGLRDAVTVEGVRSHQAAFQAFADATGGNRQASSPGYTLSGDYVIEQMEGAGYEVTKQGFEYPFFEEQQPAVLDQVSPNPTVYTYFGSPSGFATMEYSGSGDVQDAPTEAVDLSLADPAASTSGCEAADFAGFTSGNIAIIQRGGCSFAQKAFNAEAAGASGVVIFNQGNDDPNDDRFGNFLGTLGGPGATIPVVGSSYDVGVDLAAAGTTARLFVEATSEIRESFNVIADSPGGRTDRVVVVGAHLDSVPNGPGINDNGSGSAGILEIALQMADLEIQPRNQVRFAWWGAEESGLLGSEYYVSQLSAKETKNIALNLNFDMIGSPNFVRFVYDGDGSATGTAGPNGSAVIEDVFLDYFAGEGLANEPTAFDGRSDYGPFIDVGIPAGGLFTGAEGIKSAEQAVIYGGTEGQQYDPCYHLPCDTFSNNSDVALGEMSDAAAHAVLTFAMTTSSVNGTDKGNVNSTKSVTDLQFKGSRAQS